MLIAKPPPVIDAQAPEVYCSEVAWVDRTGPCVRFFLTTDGALDEREHRQVVVKVVLPFEAVIPGIELTIRRLGLEGVMRMLRVVK